MNEYTRREEIFWTLVTVCILVPSVAVGIWRLMVAEGPMVTDPAHLLAERDAKQAATDFANGRCAKSATKLDEEVGVFQSRAAQAEREAREAAERSKAKATGETTFVIPWAATSPTLKQAKALEQGKCRAASEAAAGIRDNARAAWKAVSSAASLAEPTDEKAQQDVARQLLKLFKEPGVDLKALAAHADTAQKELAARLDRATKARETQLVRGSLPEGLLPRGAAIGVGVGVSLAALIVSYVSVRSAALRRARVLVALRRFQNTPEAGLQAAAIVRLASHHNAGEPGLVIGASVGGLISALFTPSQSPSVFFADVFVAGSMGGLLVGLACQWLVRTMNDGKRWRERTKELGDLEKPSIPIALVLGGVTVGLERQFIRYFDTLPIADAALVVQTLAQQAEERIMAAAEMAAQQAQGGPHMAAGGAPGMQPGWGPPA